MNIKSTILATVITLGSACGAFAQQGFELISVTNFGSTAFTDDSWTYNSSTSRLTGTEGLGFVVYGEPVNFDFSRANGDVTGIAITATVDSAATAPLNGFSVILLDGADRSATAFFSWVNFIGGATQYADFGNVSPNFDFNNVTYWNLLGGSSNSTLDVILTNISGAVAVPEPSTYAAVAGLAVLGFVASRRRRSA